MVNRLRGELGYCHSGRQALVASYCSHHGEEPVISGWNGSGAIFFANCNLRCIYCQNYQISQHWQEHQHDGKSSQALSGIMLDLQKQGCHNINLVSPSHFVPQIVEALCLAIPAGLHIPIVYNTNSYDAPSTLSELDGIVDIYLPDLKYSGHNALKYSDAPEYYQHARLAIEEMYRQVGELVTNASGIAINGTLVRHLVLPEDIAGTQECLKWLAEDVSNTIGLSLMSQYNPSHRAQDYPELSRVINRQEYSRATKSARELGFSNLFLQGLKAPQIYLPDFDREAPFEY
jgi:putative pyruvate formate lyase activating enzyme